MKKTKKTSAKAGYRVEHDSLGEMLVPNWAYWGAQTQRSMKNFQIADQIVSLDLIHAFGAVKHAAATANEKCGKLDHNRARLIRQACEEIMAGKLDKHFPTNSYQAGAGTQTNMNVNEVIARRASKIAGKPGYVHENDHANMSQSTNDAYPTSANLCAIYMVENKLLPALDRLIATYKRLEKEHANLVKLGRTHIQDAVPITFGQEVSGWRFACENAREMIVRALDSLYVCTMGATAVGTGSTCPLKKGYAKFCCDALNKVLKNNKHFSVAKEFKVVPNLFYSTWSKDALIFVHGAIKALAMNLYKISMDVRFLASGPRSGFGEINIPQNEPGSSIMPGKVNPTQCEGMSMMCVDVVGRDIVVAWLGGGANFELNTFGTIQFANFADSVNRFANYIDSFNKNCCAGITVNPKKMKYYVDNSLMLVTALKDVIGYHKSAEIALYAQRNGLTLKEAAHKLGYISEKDYDKYVVPAKMCHN